MSEVQSEDAYGSARLDAQRLKQLRLFKCGVYVNKGGKQGARLYVYTTAQFTLDGRDLVK